MKYVELCAGAGGTRIGLDQSGWTCLSAIDFDPHAIGVYNSFASGGCCKDLKDVDPQSIPPHNVLVSGFPCQPFSSAGPRLGFHSESGNVFDQITRILNNTLSPIVLLENVRGLLNHRRGLTFLVILRTLIRLGYIVHWMLIDLKWLGVPQSRPRLIIVGYDPTLRSSPKYLFSKLSAEIGLSSGSVRNILLDKSTSEAKFGHMGIASGSKIATWDGTGANIAIDPVAMGQIVAPNFPLPKNISSVRFYARGKPTKPHFRLGGIAHCVGNIPGGAPLFAAPLKDLQDSGRKDALIEGANWMRTQEEHLIISLKPERALPLFGRGTEKLYQPLLESQATLSKKYILVANLFSPVCVSSVASLLSHEIRIS